MNKKEVMEGLGELADIAERDHEVQMARAELYKLAKYAVKLHDMLKRVSEAEGLEGWVQSKITKSADMIGSVYHHLDYEESPMAENKTIAESQKDTHCSDKCCGSDVKREDCGCSADCEHCNCNDDSIPEMSSALKAHTGNEKYGKEGMKKLQKAGREGGGEEAKGKIKDKILGKKKITSSYKESLVKKLTQASEGKSPHKKGTKKYKAHMAAKHANQ